MGSADFYEAFKKHREAERARASDSEDNVVRPDDTDAEYDESPSGDYSDFPDYEDDSNLLEAVEEPMTEETISSIHMEQGSLYSEARYSGAIPQYPPPQQPGMVTMKTSTVFCSLIVIGVGLVLSYVIGQEQGKGNPLVDTSGVRQSLSIVGPANTQPIQEPDGNEQPADSIRKQYILVLCTYDISKKEIAQLTLQRLKDGGYAKIDLAKDSKHIYLYSGPYASKEDPSLVDYQTRFKRQKDFSKCFVKPVVMREQGS